MSFQFRIDFEPSGYHGPLLASFLVFLWRPRRCFSGAVRVCLAIRKRGIILFTYPAYLIFFLPSIRHFERRTSEEQVFCFLMATRGCDDHR
jgi:hypothetical protein